MANGCQVCCCPTRVGILVGVAFALLYNLAFLGFIWGTANFTFGSADRATQFCSYPTNTHTATCSASMPASMPASRPMTASVPLSVPPSTPFSVTR